MQLQRARQVSGNTEHEVGLGGAWGIGSLEARGVLSFGKLGAQGAVGEA